MRGRPKLPKNKRKRFLGIMISPEVEERLKSIKNKSAFVNQVLLMMPKEWLQKLQSSS